MSAQYNLPMHVGSQNGDEYVIDDSYPHDNVTPPGMGWDGQSDGGGKFRLKRRRRCGQCGPCQVKENCNKCQYCMRKDVLKQACVYRKCVYLRKPVPRFRQEPAAAAAAAQKSAPTPPRKPTSTPVPPSAVGDANNSSGSSVVSNGAASNSSNSSSTVVALAPNPHMSSPTSVTTPSSHTAELSSCRLNQPQYVTLSTMPSMNNGVLDPLRHRIMDQPHRSLFDPMNHHASLDPSRSSLDSSKPVTADVSRFSSGSTAQGLNSHCKLDKAVTVVSQANDVNPAITSSLNSMNSALGSHHSQPGKCPSLTPRDPYFPSMDTWSSMPYALPHTPAWPAAALPNHHAAAAAYGFQQHPTSFPSSFSPSSCRLGMADPSGARYVPPPGPQHSFHHSMTMAGFPQDFTHATPGHASHTNMRAPMNPTFYTPPPHITPSSIHSFSGLGQFPAGQASFGPAAYSMHPHAHMYPSSFYSFRAATEPQIYNVQIYPSQNPFKHSLQQTSLTLKEKGLGNIDKGLHCGLTEEKDTGDSILEKQYFDIFSSDKSQNFEKDSVLSYYSKIVKKLKIKCIGCDSCLTPISQDFHNVDSDKGASDQMDSSDVTTEGCCSKRKKQVKLTNTTFGRSCLDCDVIADYDEISSSACEAVSESHGRNTEPFPIFDNSDQELEDRLSLIQRSLECDAFHCEDDEFSLAVFGRTVEAGLESSSDDDDEKIGDEFHCSQTDKRNPALPALCFYSLECFTPSPSSSSSSPPLGETKSVPADMSNNFPSTLLLPAILPSSSLLPSASEVKSGHPGATGSSNDCESCTLPLASCESQCLDVETTGQRGLKQKMTSSEVTEETLDIS